MAESTPQNWPIYNVKLSEEQISKLVAQVFPNAILENIQQLDRNKSFNNRIYFLQLKHPKDEDFPDDVVLKVSGRFFGSDKVQNEIACLLLLDKHCPNIPSPRVVAWSEDGTKTCAMHNGVFSLLHDCSIDDDSEPASPYGWVMTTKLPGRPLQLSELSLIDSNLVSQLSEIFSSWRTNIPHRQSVGNLSLKSAGYDSLHDVQGLQTIVSNLLLCDTQPTELPTTALEYYQHLLTDQLHKIRTNDIFSFFRPRILERLQAFRTSTLPNLPVSDTNSVRHLQDDKEGDEGDKPVTVFTHQDFAPRNILVTPTDDGSLQVAGILDFEFAGFFPSSEEFLTCQARQSDDWPPAFFNAFIADLASWGIAAPGHGIDAQQFQSLCDLAMLVENAAPWWLQAGHVQGEELEKELDGVLKVVEDLLAKLEKAAAARNTQGV